MGSQMNADLNSVLRWSIENSESSRNDPTAQQSRGAASGLDQEALRRIMLGGPSDADRMKEAMAAILDDAVSLEEKVTAFDNFEQLIEGIDNANNMEPLKLWQPLVDQLQHEEAEMRKWAAWCLATAVSNNVKAQERLLVLGAIPTLVNQATSDTSQDARKKAILALSGGVRNYQPALDKALEHIPAEHLPEAGTKVSAEDMDAVDGVISSLRQSSAAKA